MLPCHRPEKDLEKNTTYNYHISKIRTCLEHTIRYLKGTWQSLQGLHVHLDKEDHIQYACLWIITCIHLHLFVLGHQKGINISRDTFIRKGLEIMEEERVRIVELQEIREQLAREAEEARAERRDVELYKGKLK
ncbi:hypothetical protein PAXRUDRAFT_154971 [Paxillus rubicundulus Ve08.2h10]|uniref:DDE Tnp4 domain-containing protein n=1 Tax=Paxillus rubicundulus Ve08.2h10 TaxID=930991 RepID=A0A0D0CGR7_9AGAM|nr:hypothetical protein PAXRUDRAFT_154971 [Paxillus rubicundulus Ve08.2h10]